MRLFCHPHGKTVFEDYIGYADLETKKSISPDTIYRIYSNSKLITCVIELMSANHLHPELNTYFNWDYLKGYEYGLGVRVMTNPPLGGQQQFHWRVWLVWTCGHLGND